MIQLIKAGVATNDDFNLLFTKIAAMTAITAVIANQGGCRISGAGRFGITACPRASTVLFLCCVFVLAKYAKPERAFGEHTQEQQKRTRPGGAKRVEYNREDQEQEGNEMPFQS